MYVSSHAPVNPFNPPSPCSIYQPYKMLPKYFVVNFVVLVKDMVKKCEFLFWRNSWNFSLFRHPIKYRILCWANNLKEIHFANLLIGLMPKQTFGSYATLMRFRFVIGFNLPETWTSWIFSLLRHPIKCRILCWADNQKEIHF